MTQDMVKELALIEIVEAITDLAAPERQAKLEQTILTLIDAVRQSTPAPLDLDPLVAAILRHNPPTVNVQVAAPVVNFTTPEQKGAEWEVKYPTIHGTQTMTVKRIK